MKPFLLDEDELPIIGSGAIGTADPPSAGNLGALWVDGSSVYQAGKKTCKFIDQSAIPHYYCDSVNGSNANDGLTELTPKQTVSAVKALAVSSCVLEFARGSYFREQLSGLPDNCVVKAYGTGEKPMFDCADIITAFTKTGGYTNVYQKAFSNGMTDSNKAVISLWENGIRMIRVTSIALVNTTPNSFYGIGSGSGSDTVYFHASDSSDPNTNGKTYETSIRNFGVEASPGSELYELAGKRNGHQYGSIIGSKYMYGCYATDGNIHNMWNGGIAENCECYIAEGGSYGSCTLFVTYEHTPANGTSIRYTNCIARGIENALGGWKTTGVTGFLAHTNGSVKFSHVLFENCIATDLQSGITTQDTDTIVYSDCTVKNFINAFTSFRVAGSKTYLFNCKALEYNSGSTRINTERFMFCEGDLAVAKGCDVVMRRMIGGAVFSKANTVELHQNTFNFANSEINVAMIYGDVPSGCPDNLLMRRNIVYNAKKKYLDLRDTVVIDADYNNVDTSLNGAAQINATTSYLNFVDYRNATEQDANSIIADPQFIGDVRSGDLSISANSPVNAIQAGSTFYEPSAEDLAKSYVWSKIN